jgi:type IV pilus assembly protein PilO
MASLQSIRSFDFAQFQEKLVAQFQDLDPKDPSSWPPAPRYGLFLLTTIGMVVMLWFVWLSGSDETLQLKIKEEEKLKESYTKNLTKAVNLETLIKQREQVQQYVTQLEKQLPSKAEMDALLSDINQAGVGNNLQFDLFRPGQVVIKDYYAELPIAIKINGKYHDIGTFASEIAKLSRIVTLNNMTIVPSNRPDGSLIFESTAKTFRYLDKEEIAAASKASPNKPAAAPAPKGDK